MDVAEGRCREASLAMRFAVKDSRNKCIAGTAGQAFGFTITGVNSIRQLDR
jgi:hypothetical protein